MIAARLVACGDTPTFVLTEVPDPAPRAGEVVVALRAAALNRRDWWLWRDPEACAVPVTLGSDGSGVVVSAASDVDGVDVGDEVVIDATLGWGDREDEPGDLFDILGSPVDGTFAERVVVPATNVAPKPARLSWVEAAALNLAGLTAWRAIVTCAQAAEGSRLLVTGAGGGVSTFAIQIATALGARVFVTTSDEEKLGRATALGAVTGASYSDDDWPERIVELAGGPLDAAIDSYAGPSWEGALRTLRRGGTLVSFGDTGDARATVEAADVYWQWRRVVGTTMGSPREYRALLAHVAETSWTPVIDSVYPLLEIPAAAQRLLDPSRFGKVVLAIDG